MTERRWKWHGMTEAQRFWAKVEIGDADECWPWTASRDSDGYGAFFDAALNRSVRAHRWVVQAEQGEEVMHSCDNPPCVNPGHLSKGTHQDNIADMNAKGRRRGPRGVASPNAKLSSAQVAEIRQNHISRQYTQDQLAARYGVTRRVIGLVARRKSYINE